MKTTLAKYIITGVISSVLISCNLDLEPYDSKTQEAALSTAEDLQTATYGAYAGLVDPAYTRIQHFLGEYPGDNVALSGTTTDALFNIYNYTDFPGNIHTDGFWRQGYKIIFSSNQIIENIEDGQSATLDQLKGENLYLRAMVHFDLVRFFGRPYSQGDGNNPGVVIKADTEDGFPARSTVREVYDFMISDLEYAANLMTIDKSAAFASREVAHALLSRLYLFKGDYANAIQNANKVLSSNKYQLLANEAYKSYFTIVPENNQETIFAIRHTQADDRLRAAIGSMYYNDPITQSTGWGEVFASLDLVNLLNKYPEDARHSFIELQLEENGDTLKRGNVPRFFVNKYNWQEGIANLSSPVFMRLAEIYLNRAEANAKSGNLQEALDDVNILRTRAGITGDGLYSLEDLKGHDTVLDVVLEERRMELAFEGHRAGDLFRNNLPLVRAYPGFHSADRFNQTIQPDHPRVVFLIPEREIIVNPSLNQNP
ncbi:MAG TPA: RagB/SusD family nutrient uptake outer membrane protein [Lunatimonas sp.]|nr:RagB/SusD family nutrient uptake outer membrane protein [Lunatimonas sp.]